MLSASHFWDQSSINHVWGKKVDLKGIFQCFRTHLQKRRNIVTNSCIVNDNSYINLISKGREFFTNSFIVFSFCQISNNFVVSKIWLNFLNLSDSFVQLLLIAGYHYYTESHFHHLFCKSKPDTVCTPGDDGKAVPIFLFQILSAELASISFMCWNPFPKHCCFVYLLKSHKSNC